MDAEADPMVEQIRRGGTAYVVHVLALVGAIALHVGAMLTGLGWLVPLTGLALATSGAAALIARRAAVPAWFWSFLLSWFVEDALQRQRIMAVLIGVSLFGAGLLWLGVSALALIA